MQHARAKHIFPQRNSTIITFFWNYCNIFTKNSSFCGFSQWEIIFCSGMLHFWNHQLEGFQKSIGLPMLSPKNAEMVFLALKWCAWSSCHPRGRDISNWRWQWWFEGGWRVWKKKHEKRGANYCDSITIHHNGNAAGKNIPTVSIMKGKNHRAR